VNIDDNLETPLSPTTSPPPQASNKAAVPEQKDYFKVMVSIGLVRTLQTLSKRPFGDPDIKDVIQELLSHLEKMVEDVSSFAEFKQEVLSRRLEWSPVHKSEKFWKENIKRFDEDNFSILKALTQLLYQNDSPVTIEVALYDIGEFVKYHPQGRRIINGLDDGKVKTRVLELMQSTNPEINHAALACIQKILVQKWEFLQS